MTYPIQPESPFWAAVIGESRQTLFLAEQLCSVQTFHCLLFSSSSSINYHEGSSLIHGPLASISLRPRIPSWIWIRYIQYATHRNNFTSPPKLAMSTVMQNPALTPSSCFTSWQHFLETCTLLPETTRATKSRWLQRLFLQTANMTFATLWLHYGKHISLVRPTMP